MTPESKGLRVCQKAFEAAENGRPNEMYIHLCGCRFVDGLVALHCRKWLGGGEGQGRIPISESEIRAMVMETLEEAYRKVARDERIRNLGGFMWKNSEKKVRRMAYALRKAFVNSPPDSTVSSWAYPETIYQDAMRIASNLLPGVGEKQVLNVVRTVIQAAEQGVLRLSYEHISREVGISKDAARSLLSLGLFRLRREASKAGIRLSDYYSCT